MMRRSSRRLSTLPLLALLLALGSFLVWGLTRLVQAAGSLPAALDPWPSLLVAVLLALVVGAYGFTVRR